MEVWHGEGHIVETCSRSEVWLYGGGWCTKAAHGAYGVSPWNIYSVGGTNFLIYIK